jgi:Asp-tRNA(Asn)/Glu-tRNA(Gln) amidotransferase A subunit family amidase
MDAFSQFDVLLAPATPCGAPSLGQTMIALNGRQEPARASLGALTQPISAIGLPVVTAPIHGLGPLPIGVQIIAAPWREDLAFQAAAQLERAGLASAPLACPGV